MANTNPTSLLGGKRFFIVLFLFSNVVINYADRVNLSIAAPALAKDFHWDAAQMGWVFSAYLWTYAACLIPCGWLADRFGARRTSAIAISVWSAAAMLTGAVTNFGNMVAARLALGVGEATTFPVCNKVVRQWFPAGERAFATGLFHSGVYLSIALASPMVAWLVVQVGWRASFLISGSLGFVWLLLWLRWFQPPETCAWLPSDERQLILEHRDQSQATGETPNLPNPLSLCTIAGTLLRQQTMWGLALTQGCINYMNNLFLLWLPSYLVQARGMSLMSAGIYTAIPYLVGALLEIVFGKLSDRILNTTRQRQGGRRNQVVAVILLSSVVLLIPQLESAPAILAVISLALACNTTAIALMYSLTNDLVGDSRVAGTAFGILLCGGNLFGLVAPIATGYIVKATGSFNAAFALSGAFALAGSVLAFTCTRRPISGPLDWPSSAR